MSDEEEDQPHTGTRPVGLQHMAAGGELLREQREAAGGKLLRQEGDAIPTQSMAQVQLMHCCRASVSVRY